VRVRRNADRGYRELERKARTGDRVAQVQLHKALQRQGLASMALYYAQILWADFMDDVSVRTSPSLLGHPMSEVILVGIDLVPGQAGIEPWEEAVVAPGHEADLMIPDRFDRPDGYVLSMLALPSQRSSSLVPGAGYQDHEPSLAIRVQVALSMLSQPGRQLHPLYWFHRNSERWSMPLERRLQRRVPRRFERETILARRLTTPGRAVNAVAEALVEALKSMDMRLRHVDRLLQETALLAATQTLHTAPGPVIGAAAPGSAKPTVAAWNVSGDGMAEAALMALADWLTRNHRAVINELRCDPFGQESGYFTRGYLTITSRRARRTRNPLQIELDWDRVNGAWDSLSDQWAGNELPTEGLWKINMVGCPGTVQDLYQPAVNWIRSVFPEAGIEVAAWHEPGSYGRPAYRPL
jgi:hypothetical protein